MARPRSTKRKPQPPEADGPSRRPLVGLGAIIVLTLLVYASSLSNEVLAFDDIEYFQKYPEITHLSLQGLGAIFTHHYVLMYQPLPVLTFALSYRWFGLAPFPLHAFNLFFHLVNVGLVFAFVLRLSKRSEAALLVCALFALHPMNVESVAWLSARSSGMYLAFLLLALLAYLRHLDRPTPRRLGPVLVFFVLSLLCKVQAMVLPGLLFVVDALAGRRLSRWSVLEKLPFVALSVGFGLLALTDKTTLDNLEHGIAASLTPLEVFFMGCYSLVFYVGRLFVPIGLSAIYAVSKLGGRLPTIYTLAPALLALVIALVAWLGRRRRFILLGALFFLVAISVNIQIVPSRLFAVADRYAYLPYLGLFLVLGLLYCELRDRRPRAGKVYLSLLVAGLATCAGLSFARTRVWRDSETLTTDIINKNPPVQYMYRAYGTRGTAKLRRKDYAGAIADFSRALELNPDDVRTYYNRAVAYKETHNAAAALADLDRTVALAPHLANVFNLRQSLRYAAGDKAGALADANRAIELDPSLHNPYNTRAILKAEAGDRNGAEADFTRAVAARPDYAEGYRNRGMLRFQAGRYQDCIDDLSRAIVLEGGESGLYLTRAKAYLALAQKREGCRDLESALDLGERLASEQLRQSCQ